MFPRGEAEEDEKVLADEKIIINFDEARRLALHGILDYFSGVTGGVRFGLFHGEKGKNRAGHVSRYLIALGNDEDSFSKRAGLLALFLTIFTITRTDDSNNIFWNQFRNPFENVGRSSQLASLIADSWIRGEVRDNRGSLISTVFSENALAIEADNDDNHRTEYTSYRGPGQAVVSWYADNTKIARQLLNMALNSPACEHYKAAITKSVSWLRAHLEGKPAHFWVAKSLLPCSAIERTVIEGITAGVFATNGRATLDNVLHISSFLTRKDAARLIVNKQAYAQSEQPTAEEKAAMKNARNRKWSPF
ncbi:MAG TPA: hypothetical protein VLI69_04500 [Gammaproteobacteria bacterium]|nr:hypothetical protein [Gammaproteobacteria bacterium]